MIKISTAEIRVKKNMCLQDPFIEEIKSDLCFHIRKNFSAKLCI